MFLVSSHESPHGPAEQERGGSEEEDDDVEEEEEEDSGSPVSALSLLKARLANARKEVANEHAALDRCVFDACEHIRFDCVEVTGLGPLK